MPCCKNFRITCTKAQLSIYQLDARLVLHRHFNRLNQGCISILVMQHKPCLLSKEMDFACCHISHNDVFIAGRVFLISFSVGNSSHDSLIVIFDTEIDKISCHITKLPRHTRYIVFLNDRDNPFITSSILKHINLLSSCNLVNFLRRVNLKITVQHKIKPLSKTIRTLQLQLFHWRWGNHKTTQLHGMYCT